MDMNSVRSARSSRWAALRRVFLVVLVAGLVATAGAVTWRVAGPSPDGTWASLDATDRAMLTELSAQYDRAAADPAGVWTADFHYEEQPFLLLRTSKSKSARWQYAFLVNMSDVVDTSGMRRVVLPDMPLLDDVYVSKTFGLTAPLLHLPANFTDLEFDGTSLSAFKFHPAMFDPEAPTNDDFRHFSAHEHFHVAVQGVDPEAEASWKYDDAGYLDDVPSSPEHDRLLRAELAALDQARAAVDESSARSAAADAVRLRLARQEAWPTLRKQDGIETIEGVATYFEAKVNGDDVLVGQQSLVDAVDHFGDSVLGRDLYYWTGASIGGTLDVLRPGWKDELSASGASGAGPTLFDMLRQSTDVAEVPPAGALDALVAAWA